MRKKPLVLLIVLILAVLALAGCTPNGGKYLALQKEMALLPQYAYTEAMTISFEFSDSLMAELTPSDAALLAKFQDIELTLSGNYLAAEMYQDFELTLRLKDGTTGSLRCLMDKDAFYINTADMTALLNQFAPVEVEAFAAATEDVEWLKLDQSEYASASGVSTLPDFQGMATEYIEAYYDYLDYLNAHSFAAYKPDIFSASGNKYTMNITADKLYPVFKDFIDYLYDNRADIIKDTRDFAATLDSGIFSSLGFEKEDVLAALDEAAVASQALKAEDKKDFDLQAYLIYSGMFEGSSIKYSLEKKGEGIYQNRMDIKFALTSEGESMTVRIKDTTDIDANVAVTPNIPAAGAKTIEQIAASLEPSTLLTIQTPGGSASWENSYDCSLFDSSGDAAITLKNVDGSYYLPLRQVGELCGEDVQWDAAVKKAYATVNGQKIFLTGIADNGRIYVKLRELEKLGFAVTWDGATKEITVAK